MHYGHHRVSYYRRKRKKTGITAGGVSRLFDDAAYLMGVTAVAVNIPQLLDVWLKPDISGVSLTSWTGIFLGSCFWLGYGILHKEKPLIVINLMLLSVQGLIVVGILVR